MRLRTTICIAAITAALAVPASTGAAEHFYGGKISNGGKIGVDVTTLNGKPFQVNAMRYKRLLATCTTGSYTIGSTWTFTNFAVTNNKFAIDGPSSEGDYLLFKGTFKKQGKRLEGRIQEGPTDFGPPAGTCTSANRQYEAGRGNKGPHPQTPKANLHRAFRVAR